MYVNAYIDEELKQKLVARDESTLKSLFEQTTPSLMRLLASKGYRNEQAEDLLCDTWLSFLQNLDSFEHRSSIKTYLTGILFNKIRELHRAQKKYVAPEEDLESLINSHFTKDGWWKKESQDLSQLYHVKEIGLKIEDCLEGLSPNQRQAFHLKEIENEATDEICKIMNITVTNLGVLIYRAKDKLKSCLKGATQLDGVKEK